MKRTPTYHLDELKRLLADPATRIIRQRDRAAAASLGYADDDEMVERINQLRSDELYKSMPAEKCPGLWQDVYITAEENGDSLYIKLQKSYDGKGVVISFKKDTGANDGP
uniref:Toxin, RelE family n=1 Tax=Geobacter metallireducens TaxID=28232 RepID=A0A831U033_GEOME